MPLVAIALGSNLGDRGAHLRWALNQLRPLLATIRVSAFIETDPVDVPDEQPNYLNAVVVGETTLSPQLVLRELLRIERARGRERKTLLAPRTLDLDLILHGSAIMDTPTLTVPHARFRDRMFVLGPLAEIAPEMIDPVTGKTVGELLKKLEVRSSEFE